MDASSSLSAVSSAIGLFSTAINYYKQWEASQELESMINKEAGNLYMKRTKLENEDFLKTPIGASGMQAISDAYKDSWKKSGQAGTIMGSSAEEKIAKQKTLNEEYVDQVQKWAGNASAYMDPKLARLDAQDQAIFNKKMDIQAGIIESAGNAASNSASGTTSSLGGLSSLFGGSGGGGDSPAGAAEAAGAAAGGGGGQTVGFGGQGDQIQLQDIYKQKNDLSRKNTGNFPKTYNSLGDYFS